MIFETAKFYKGKAELFTEFGEAMGKENVFRVKDSANEIMVVVISRTGEKTLTIRSSNHIFDGGKDMQFPLGDGVSILILDASKYVQVDGENKGCIVFGPCDDTVFIDVKEIIC